ncbi:hypothetical protein MNBD_GAMMA18-2441 [hydrothermal vent metagenome]|uniref:Cytochrome c n=1 Tax=hydrothermal vent metagenome TaxID=652676 RepID=A0A3B0YT35_9ZZZZ
MKPLHARSYQILTIILSLILLALVGKFFLGSSTSQAQDGREIITLTLDEAAHIGGEMRHFLTAIQQISQGIAENNMGRAAEAATAVSMGKKHHAPITLMAKLPPEFRKLGFSLRSQFGEMATTAQAGEREELLKQLSETLQRCNACHERFTLSGQ